MLSLSYRQAQGFNTTQPTSFLHWALKHSTVTKPRVWRDVPLLFANTKITKEEMPLCLAFLFLK